MSDGVVVEHGTSAGGTDAPAGLPPVDRRTAFASGVPKMPRRVVYLAVAAVLVLGLGGTLADRFVTSGAAAPHKTTGRHTALLPSAHPLAPSGPSLTAPMHQFLGLTSLKGKAAPAFELVNAQTRAPVSLASLRGHVVVLTFLNAPCNDICPVLASELRQAAALVGTTKTPVTFVTVNSDPLDVTLSGATILSQATLAAVPNWRFLTGTVRRLTAVWRSYHIGITADRKTGVASHNELLYFIGPNGRMSWSAMPFANESTSGAYSLPPASITRFAQGIAQYADKLAGAA